MKKDIILAGVGGQGILTIAATIGYAAVESNLFLKQAEVHGMSQRGGDVQSHFRLSDKPINSDLIPEGKADLIIAVEPMEALRYTSYLAPDGWLITNTKPFINIPNYPAIEDVLAEIDKQPHSIALDADRIAKDLGTPKAANIVTLGAASKVLGMDMSTLELGLKTLFGRKGDKILQSNIDALRAGREFADKM